MKWKLDEDEPINKIELLGSIELSINNQIMSEECIFVDDFYDKLCDGIEKIKSSNYVEIELIDEPDPLIFEIKSNKNLIIKYKNDSIEIDKIEELINEIKVSFDKLDKYIFENDKSKTDSKYFDELKEKINQLW